MGCDSVRGTYTVTEDCCLEFTIFNPECYEDLYLTFQQIDESTGQYVDDGTVGPLAMSDSITYKMCAIFGQTSISWRIKLKNIHCIPACNWAGEVDGKYGPPQLGKISNGELPEDREEYIYAISTRTGTDVFEVSIVNRGGATTEINIFDFNGNRVGTNKSNLTIGVNNFSINISGLSSGTYLYSISIDGRALNTGKFIIVR